MGNISSMARASTALDSYVSELGTDISYEKSLSSSRFMKTIVARHKNGPLVLKIFIKPDANMTLRVIQRRLKTERDALAHLPNVNTYANFIESDKAGYLIRQWVGSSLYDRLSTQPYLTEIEKKWIAFQLLTCLRDARTSKVPHGDIKTDNVLITSDLTVLVTDFSSSFKPTYLPLDDPSDFAFFFDTSARRTCYIAPERFYEANSKIAQDKAAAVAAASSEPGASSGADSWEKRDGKVTEEMDVFSAGCVLAETWTDGRTVFNLSELFAYRNGSLGLGGILDNLEGDDVKSMIASMLSREPSERPTFDRILATYRGTIFPEYFYTFLKDYATELAEIPDSPDPEFLQKASTLPGSKIDRMLEQWDSISVHLEGRGANENGPALLLLNIVTSSIRNALSPSSRLHGLKLFLNLCPFLMDEDKVDRVVPFVVELLSDEVPIVRAEACRTLVYVVESVQLISQHNATFIPEYLLPQTGNLANDPDVFVRATYARALVRFADAAVRMLELCQSAQPVDGADGSPPLGDADYDALLAEIQTVVENQTSILLVDSSPNVKRGMLSTVSDLCLFFGRQKSNDVVLSHIMTYLNDRDWQLRLAFFDGIVAVGAFIGIKAIDEYVLPLMMQALADPEEAVVARVIGSLSSLTSLGLLPRLRLWDVFSIVQGFLYHPNTWIRQGAAGFVAAAARNLPQSDVWCILYPSVRTALRADVLTLDEASILSALVPPLSRATLQLAKSAALQNSPPGFWSVPPSRSTAKAVLTKSATSKGGNEFPQLKDKGISPKDEKKIIALRDLIAKQAFASRAREGSDGPTLPEAKLTTGKSISLIELGVTPQTVFISPRTVGVVDARLDLKRLRPDLVGDTPSRRTSFASRSARGAPGDGANPLEEVRKRLASLDPPTRASTERGERPEVAHTASPSESAISSTVDAVPPSGGRHRLGSKAAPAVAAVTTTAVGATTIHDEPGQVAAVPTGVSGRSTPVASTPVRGPLAPYASTYEGADPGVRAFLEQVDLENYREPLLDFGPRVVASHRKRGARAASSSPKQVTMIAHLPQHTGAVTAIVTSPDEVFFATASEDSSILIWDVARLERTVAARPRLTYRMDAPIRTMCRIDETHCLAAAAEDGSLSILRVHVSATGSSAKYKSIEVIRTWRTSEKDGYVMHVSHLHESSLLIVTSTGMIGVLDMRTMELRTQLYQPQELGPVSAVYPSQHWLVVGTVTGALSLWDLRFGLLLKSWSASGGITSLALHPSQGRGRWVMASIDRTGNASNDTTAIGGASSSDGSGGGPLVETYDIETGRLVESYEVRTTRPSSRTPAREQADVLSTKSELIAELAGGRGGVPTITFDSNDITSVQSVLVGQGFASLTGPSAHRDSADGGASGGGASEGGSERSGPQGSSSQSRGWMVTAGDDRVIRYWDLSRPSDGFVICGSQREKDVGFKASPTTAGSSTPQLYYTLPNSKSTPGGLASSPDVPGPGVPRSAHAANQQRQPLRPHYDSVCALGVVETLFSSCVVSADRSGVIKVWRMEGGQARQ